MAKFNSVRIFLQYLLHEGIVLSDQLQFNNIARNDRWHYIQISKMIFWFCETSMQLLLTSLMDTTESCIHMRVVLLLRVEIEEMEPQDVEGTCQWHRKWIWVWYSNHNVSILLSLNLREESSAPQRNTRYLGRIHRRVKRSHVKHHLKVIKCG